MIKHTQTIRRLLPRNCLSVFDYFVGLALQGLKKNLTKPEVWTSPGLGVQLMEYNFFI